ncbi:MAG: precorrin-8X methylmutase [Deltaproteobacteria bacterium]|nr:precorrin-8X methylmutase [Deltaproteobacteria bacterium]
MAETKNKTGLLILGHGSKLVEANDTLRRVAESIKERTAAYSSVVPAFLQMERPDFGEAVHALASDGIEDIVVMPYFLYPGAHVTKDLPEEIEAAKARHPQLRFAVTGNIGYHEKLIEIVLERIGEALPPPPFVKGPAPECSYQGDTGGFGRRERAAFSQHPIEKESFRLISEGLGAAGINEAELPVIKRVIHSTADFEYKDIIRFSPLALTSGIGAIRAGKAVITDVKMVDAGISRDRLAPFGSRVYCFSSDADVIERAMSTGGTRAAISMEKAAPYMQGAVVAIGNAPTALNAVLMLYRERNIRPALVVGVPVGFVGAEESKEELMRSGLEHITTVGRKGGSTVAVAIVNALVIEADKGEAVARS